MRRLPSYRDEQLGVVYAPGQYPGMDDADSMRNRRRKRIFLSVFAVSLLVSLAWTLLRPAIYESRATLLVTPPVLDERLGAVSNTQHVELEIQYLAGHSLLARVLDTLRSQAETVDLTLSDLDGMLQAAPVANTNLVEMTARGPVKELLPVVINTWITVYQQTQADSIAVESAAEMTESEKQLEDVGRKVTEKRQQLDRFRKQYDIVSMERNENRLHKQLSGLTDSLNKANEEMVSARARTAAIRQAIADGRPVVSEHGKDSVTNLEQRLTEIQEQLKEMEYEFTPHYMAIDPAIKGLVRKRDLLVEEISDKQAAGQQIALAEAEQNQASAEQSVISLQAQLDAQKQQVMEFTTRFTEHEALQEELLQLETLYREVQNRQLQNEVNNKQLYPQIDVKEPAFLPDRPVYPDYLRDSGLSLVGSVLLGLLVLGLYDFLNRSGRHSGVTHLNPVVVNLPGAPALDQARNDQLPAAQASPALAQPLTRELAVSEVLTLLKVADARSRLLITLMLSGLSGEEVHAMKAGDIDADSMSLFVRGAGERSISVSAVIAGVLSECLSAKQSVDSPVFADSRGEALEKEDLAALLVCTAHDAGLANPDEVTLQALRHTYLAYLVRRGVRLSELGRVAGDMPPSELAAYTTYAPPGAGVALDTVDKTYPAYASLK
ncbi:tyrosine-type recombinase/integrase [Gammaproteobacteria bacterium]|nr:tyrosine-type recombinase/integrase [Gammaproteobacteria bacterium]